MRDIVRDFIRENLIIEAEYEGDGHSNNMTVNLRLLDETEPFCSTTIFIGD